MYKYGFEPAYLVEFFKVGQVTWFCTKLGQVTWICKILDQVTWSAQFAQVQITWFLEFEGQVTWFGKIVDQVTWETKCEDQITSTTILQKWTRLPGRPDYLVAAKSGPDYLVAASWAQGDGLCPSFARVLHAFSPCNDAPSRRARKGRTRCRLDRPSSGAGLRMMKTVTVARPQDG